MTVSSSFSPRLYLLKAAKKDKIILLFKQGETSSAITANKVSCAAGYVNTVKNDLRPARLSAVEQRSLEVPRPAGSSLWLVWCWRCSLLLFFTTVAEIEIGEE